MHKEIHNDSYDSTKTNIAGELPWMIIYNL